MSIAYINLVTIEHILLQDRSKKPFFPSLFLQKAEPPYWPTQMADHLVPNQVLGFFEFFREREGEVFCFQRLANVFIGADSKNLKMRRLPPYCSHSILAVPIIRID
jgi:hypothetical protein